MAGQDDYVIKISVDLSDIEKANAALNDMKYNLNQVGGAGGTAMDSLRNTMRQVGNDTRTVAANFTDLIGTGRAFAELGRAGSIIGRLIGDQDLVRVSQMTLALGDLVMVAGRLPQVLSVFGGIGPLAALGVGAAGLTALAQISNRPVQEVAAGPYGRLNTAMGDIGKNQTRPWLESQGINLPDLGKLGQDVTAVDQQAIAVRDALQKYRDSIFNSETRMDKMGVAQLQVADALLKQVGALTGGLGMFGVKTPYSELGAYAQQREAIAREQATPTGMLRQALSQGNTGAINQMFPTNAMDLTKYSQDEITRAKQMSVQATQSELTALRDQATAMGLNKDEVDKIVQLRQQEINAMLILVTLQGQSSYLSGAEANHLSEMLSAVKSQESQAKSNFQFERLRDTSASDFAAIAQRAQGYNSLLSKLGSPEEMAKITVLLDGGVMKTLNIRMSALQMAIEDQTKVAKAQLSGTWNLPSGATALVPISSLDLQRWNSRGGGSGFDPAALAGLMGTTQRSGDKVATSVNSAAAQITAAIEKAWSAAGVPFTHDQTVRIGNQILKENALEDIRLARSLAATPIADRSYDAIENIRAGRLNPASAMSVAPVNINVSAVPIKASATNVINVTLDSRVIATAVQPYFNQWLLQALKGQGYSPKVAVR
jgi:hypothetical protein